MLKRHAVDPMCRNPDLTRPHGPPYPVSQSGSYLDYYRYTARHLGSRLRPSPNNARVSQASFPFFPHVLRRSKSCAIRRKSASTVSHARRHFSGKTQRKTPPREAATLCVSMVSPRLFSSSCSDRERQKITRTYFHSQGEGYFNHDRVLFPRFARA